MRPVAGRCRPSGAVTGALAAQRGATFLMQCSPLEFRAGDAHGRLLADRAGHSQGTQAKSGLAFTFFELLYCGQPGFTQSGRLPLAVVSVSSRITVCGFAHV